jgi:ADP-heptose:LPS heptosyltransferase/tetratricopeptide (TPR) repeat protein
VLESVAQLLSRTRSGRPPAASSPIGRADDARDRRAWLEAAQLYEAALAQSPDDAAIHIQCGHMWKEAGELARAEARYRIAQDLTPDDPDLALQLGHFYKVAGRLDEAEQAYLRALALVADWREPQAELDALRRQGFQGRAALQPAIPAASVGQPSGACAPYYPDSLAAAGPLAALEGLAPEVAPRHPGELLVTHREGIEIRRLGRRERTRWGTLNTLRGAEALRGFCLSAVPLKELCVLLGEQVIHRQAAPEGVPVRHERDDLRLRKYVFNVWYDFARFAQGRYDLEVRGIDVHRRVHRHRQPVVVAAPLDPADNPECDGLVALSPADARPVEAQVNAAPSMVRPARRAIFAEPPRTVLVLRLDQLGDMVCSVPALRRLREILPHSRLVGLIAPANRELERSLGLFDEVLIADFPDDPLERRRVMTLAQQEALRRRLEPYRFDMAIDLSDSGNSRPLLFLSGAPFLYGFRHGEFPWLSAGFEGVTRDFANGLERVAHTSKMMGLVEWLGVLLRQHATVERRADLSRAVLAPLGLDGTERFVVLHTGARIAFSRWPHYDRLATLILQRTALRVVMVSDEPAQRAGLADGTRSDPRFRLLDKDLGFDVFDALVSFCSGFVGNDSGPKHLASLRGAPVVSIHLARNNWNEWGQENGGLIVSRKVPCAGCSIHHDPEECGKGFPCIAHITAEEVFAALARLL